MKDGDGVDYEAKYKALILRLKNDEGMGVYPMGHMPREEREGEAIKKTDAYRCGWNDAVIKGHYRLAGISDLDDDDDDEADPVTMLLASDCCFFHPEDGTISLNMNDTWAWACADIPTVPKEEVKEVARLFRSYGFAGLCYWHSMREGGMRSEFTDINRKVDFVKHEEQIRKDMSDSKRAHVKVKYTLGEE